MGIFLGTADDSCWASQHSAVTERGRRRAARSGVGVSQPRCLDVRSLSPQRAHTSGHVYGEPLFPEPGSGSASSEAELVLRASGRSLSPAITAVTNGPAQGLSEARAPPALPCPAALPAAPLWASRLWARLPPAPPLLSLLLLSGVPILLSLPASLGYRAHSSACLPQVAGPAEIGNMAGMSHDPGAGQVLGDMETRPETA